MLNSSVLSIDLYSDRNLMLKECAKRKYAYVYPLSGHGFSIKSWDYIHIIENEGKGKCWNCKQFKFLKLIPIYNSFVLIIVYNYHDLNLKIE